MYSTSMRNNRRFLFTVFLIFYAGFVLHAQSLPSVASYSLTSEAVGENVTRTVNDLVFSFIKEVRTYRIIDMRSDVLPSDLRVLDGTDYLFYGTLTGVSDGIRLELVLKGGPFAVTRLISRVYENSNRILLESRMLVRDLFDQSVALPDPLDMPSVPGDKSVAVPTVVSAPVAGPARELVAVRSLDSLAGSWRGEEGIEKVMLLRGGRGVAILFSGISIPLELSLSAGDLVIRQKGMANPRQFMDLSDSVAKQAATIAPPLEWRFLITTDQKTLSGIKKTVIINNDGKNILTMEAVVLDTRWERD